IRTPAPIVPGLCASFHGVNPKASETALASGRLTLLSAMNSMNLRIGKSETKYRSQPVKCPTEKTAVKIKRDLTNNASGRDLQIAERNPPKVLGLLIPPVKSGAINDSFSNFQRWSRPLWLIIGSFGWMRSAAGGAPCGRPPPALPPYRRPNRLP